MTGEPDDRASVPSGELLTMRKTLSFAAVHFLTAFAIGYLMTGSVWVGGALALVEPACNTVAFHFHERVWMRLEARRGRTRSGHLAAPGLG